MKAIQITQTGGPEVLKYVDLPDPKPGPGQALIDVKAIGVNFMDIYNRSGLYRTNVPMILGGEGAGTVSQIGSGVTDIKAGDRVAWASGGSSYAEKVVNQAERLVKLPQGVNFELGATAMLQGMTAHYLSHDTYPLKKGDMCLIHAAAGGVGQSLVQLAKLCGATVIATVSTQDKATLVKGLGADHVILYSQQDFAEEVKRITGGQGVEVVYDSVGATTFDKGLEILKPRGYMVLYGQSSGLPNPVSPATLQAKSLFMTRPGLGHYTATREDLVRRATAVFNLIAQGKLKMQIFGTYPLKDAAEAHRRLENRETTGKLLLVP
ncbi:MAG: quinone oxidoreductase [Chloroflexi bacterium]|nr:quinone oxidoreductase [Chloroflexota bacterium]